MPQVMGYFVRHTGHSDSSKKSEQEAGTCCFGQGFREGPGMTDRSLQMSQEPPSYVGHTEVMPELRIRRQ